MNLQVATLDVVVIFLIFAAVIGIGFILYKRGIDNDDYLIAGRKLKWFSIGFHGAASYVGVGTLMGALGWVYADGIGGAIYPATLCISFAVMALIAKRLRCLEPVTTGDLLEKRFNKMARIPAGIAIIMAMIGSAGGQIKAFGALGETVLGIDATVCVIIFSVIALGYTLLGGMLAVAYTDVMQGIIMIGTVVFIMFPIILNKSGGVSEALSQLPESFTDPTVYGWPTIISYILVYGVLLSFFTTDGQRMVFAAKGIKDAKAGSWFAFVLLAVFTVVAAIIGICGAALVPGIEVSDNVFPTLCIAVLPTGLCGLALGGILAAGMSTYDTATITASSVLVKDFIEAYRKSDEPLDGKTEKKWSIIVSLVVGVIITVLAITGESILAVVNLGFDMACCTTSAAMLAALFWPRATSAGCLSSMIVGFLAWLVMYFNPIALMGAFVAVPVSLVVLIVVSLLTKPEDDVKLKDFYKNFGWVIGGAKWNNKSAQEDNAVE